VTNMDWQMIGVVAAIGIQTLIAMFWAGTFSANITNLTKAVEKLQSRDDLFVKRNDYLEQVAARSREVSDLWKAQNELRDKFNDCRAKKDCQAG
jgi:hypothetical protein